MTTPQYLPFAIDQNTAETILNQWLATKAIKDAALISVEAVYYPVYRYDVVIVPRWRAQVGLGGELFFLRKASLTNETDMYWRWTDTTTATGQLTEITVRGLLVPAAVGLDVRVFGALVERQTVSAALQAMPDDGAAVIQGRLSGAQARQAARDLLETQDIVDRAALEDGGKHDAYRKVNPALVKRPGAVQNLELEIDYNAEQLGSLWLPVYRVTYRQGLREQMVLINGMTGRLCVLDGTTSGHYLRRLAYNLLPSVILFWLWIIFGVNTNVLGVAAVIALVGGVCLNMVLIYRWVTVGRKQPKVEVYDPQ